MQSNSTSDGVKDRKLISTGSTGKSSGIKKRRIVIGLLDPSANLSDSLEALIEKGFATADLCVSGTIDMMSTAGSKLQNRTDIDPALVTLFTRTGPFQAIESSQTIMGSQGSLLSTLNGLLRQSHDVERDGSCGKFNKVFLYLAARIELGQFGLVVDADEPRQLIHASKVLLKFSPEAIQTHEFLAT